MPRPKKFRRICALPAVGIVCPNDGGIVVGVVSIGFHHF